MLPMLLRIARSPRSRRHATTVMAVAMLLFGGVAHLLHHVEDPSCDRGPGPASHVCASCAGLHGGAMAEEAPAPVTAEPARDDVPADLAAVPATRVPARDAAPRAPPLA